MTWRRARRPEQIEARRRAILGAAEKLYRERGLDGVSLNAIAAEADLAKSNVYRYFESREQVFLELLRDELEQWAGAASTTLAQVSPGDVDGAAVVLADSVVARPRLAALFSALPSILESNVSAETAARFRQVVADALGDIADGLATSLPGLSAEAAEEAIHYISVFAIGLWPVANPSEELARAFEEPEFQHLRHDFREELVRLSTLVLNGLLGEEGESGVMNR